MNVRKMCQNWKFLVGIAIVALAVLAIAPKLAWGLIPFLFILVCPLMMFLMMRGMGTMGSDRNAQSPVETSPVPIPAGTREERLAELKARNETLTRQVVELEAEDESPPEPGLAAGPSNTTLRNRMDATA